MEPIRLQKHIANLGIASRRKAEELILAGKVKVNGVEVKEMGIKVDPENDAVEVIDHPGFPCEIESKASAKKVYIALNKPIDVISSNSSEQGECVIDLLTKTNAIGREKREVRERVYPVGRLDKDSEGLVLLTNDGELTNQLTHPRYEHEKEYEVMIDAQLSRDAKKVLTKGMIIGDGEYVHGIKIIKEWNKGRRTIVTVLLKEGKNRQIRKMFGKLGYHVQSLKRTRINNLKLGTLPVGKWKFVKKEDII